MILTALALLLITGQSAHPCREFKCHGSEDDDILSTWNLKPSWQSPCTGCEDSPLCTMAKEAAGCNNPETTWKKIFQVQPSNFHKLSTIVADIDPSLMEGVNIVGGVEKTLEKFDYMVCVGEPKNGGNAGDYFSEQDYTFDSKSSCEGGDELSWECKDIYVGQTEPLLSDYHYVLYRSTPVCFCAHTRGRWIMRVPSRLCGEEGLTVRNSRGMRWLPYTDDFNYSYMATPTGNEKVKRNTMWPLWIFLGLAVGSGSGYAVAKYTNSAPDAPRRPDHYFSPAEEEPMKSEAAPVSANRARRQMNVQQEQRQEESHHSEVRMWQEQRNHAPAIGVGC